MFLLFVLNIITWSRCHLISSLSSPVISIFNRICFGWPIFLSLAPNESCRPDLKHWEKSFISISNSSVSSFPFAVRYEIFNNAVEEGCLGNLKLPLGTFDVWNTICQVFVEDFPPGVTVDVELVSLGDLARVTIWKFHKTKY